MAEDRALSRLVTNRGEKEMTFKEVVKEIAKTFCDESHCECEKCIFKSECTNNQKDSNKRQGD